MFTLKELINYENDYLVENHKVYFKTTKELINDPSTILKVKSAKLLYRFAKNRFEQDINKNGFQDNNVEQYLKNAMSIFSLNAEINDHEINKLINKILTNIGHFEESSQDSNLSHSKYYFLVEPEKDYGLAYLKLKFRELGLDLQNLNLICNYDETTKNYIISIDYQTKAYIKRYSHPMAPVLTELEKELKNAQNENNHEKVNQLTSKITQLISRYPATVSKKEFHDMSLQEQMDYYTIKMHEAKILKDISKYNYWQQKLFTLKSKQNNFQKPAADSKPNYLLFYQNILELVKSKTNTPLDLTTDILLLSEIAYYQEKLLSSLTTEKEIIDILTLIATDLGSTEFELNISQTISTELQSQLSALRNNKSAKKPKSSIDQLKKELTNLIEEYNSMLSDGIIDSEELEILATKIEELDTHTQALKELYQNHHEQALINSINSKIAEFKNQIITLLEGTKEPKK